MQSQKLFNNHVIDAKLIRLERIRWLILLFFCLCFLFIGYHIQQTSRFDWFHLLFFGLCILGYGYFLKVVALTFKQKGKPYLLKELIRSVSNESAYYPSSRLSMDQITMSGFFPENLLYVEGEDLILYKKDQVRFDVCELRVWCEEAITGGVDRIFSGVLMTFIVDLPMEGELLIWPKIRTKSMMRSTAPFFKRGASQLENRSSNTHNFFAIGSHLKKHFPFNGMIDFLNDHQSFEQPLYISVKNNIIFLALEYDDDQFEIGLFKQLNQSFANDQHQFIRDIEQLVSQVNQLLNETS